MDPAGYKHYMTGKTAEEQHRWYGAIAERHSYRNYLAKAVEPEKLARLSSLCMEISRAAARAVVIEQPFEMVSRGIIGAYGKITGAPAYAAFVVNTSHPYHRQLAGYVGEGIVLEAVSLGLATCWVGGYFLPRVVASHITLVRNEQVLAVTPLGYRTPELALKDRLFKAMARSRKRKPLADLTNGLQQEKWPAWIRAGLEAARVAPSAVNRQPWRFLVEQEAVILSVDSGRDDYRIPKRLDCGIAMLHFELGARHVGYPGSWHCLKLPQVARFVLD